MKQRPLVICAIAFFTGILLSFYNLSGLITFLMIAMVCSAYFIKKNKLKFFAVILVVILFGAARMNLAQVKKEKIISKYTGDTGKMTLVITSPSTDGKTIARLRTPDGNIGIYLTADKRCEFSAGDIVTAETKLHVPIDSKTGARAFSNYLASCDVYLQANCKDVRITGRYEEGIMGKIYSLRSYANELGRRYFSGDSRALFNAMVLGDKSLLSDELYASLQGSGLNHIAVVSGMHLSVIISFMIYIIKKFMGRGRFGYILAILIAIFITLLTGAGASIVRALIMCLIYLLSRILYREKDGATSLFCAFWIMIIINPYIIFNMGFALSVVAVLGLILYSKKFTLFFEHFIPQKVADAISLTLAAQLSLTPLIVYYFGIITPYAPFSNVLAVPLSSVYVILGMILVFLSPIKPVASVLTPIMEFLADGIISLCESISNLPYALIEHSEDFLLFTALWIFFAVIIFYYPIPPQKLKKYAVFLCVAGVSVSYISRMKFDRFFFTPYGEETLAYVESADTSFLIDCPDIYDAASLGTVRREIVLTKKDFQEAFDLKREARRVYLSFALFDQNEQEQVILAARKRNVAVAFKDDGESFSVGKAAVRYIDAGVQNARAVEINLSGKRIITLQGFSQSDIEKIIKNCVKFRCDYIYIPHKSEGYETLTMGEIISNNKFSLQR